MRVNQIQKITEKGVRGVWIITIKITLLFIVIIIVILINIFIITFFLIIMMIIMIETGETAAFASCCLGRLR